MLQLPYLPELLMRARDYNALEQGFFSKFSVSSQHPICHCYFRTKCAPQGLKNQQNFPKEVLEAFKYSFSQTGVCTAALNYYRNLFNTDNHCHDKKIDVPVLFIWVRRASDIIISYRYLPQD